MSTTTGRYTKGATPRPPKKLMSEWKKKALNYLFSHEQRLRWRTTV